MPPSSADTELTIINESPAGLSEVPAQTLRGARFHFDTEDEAELPNIGDTLIVRNIIPAEGEGGTINYEVTFESI